MWKPETDLPEPSAWQFRVVAAIRMITWARPFTDRQLVALTTFSDLVGEARERVRLDAVAAGMPDDGVPLREGGTGATAYAEAVGVYLACGISERPLVERSAIWANTAEKCSSTSFRTTGNSNGMGLCRGNPFPMQLNGLVILNGSSPELCGERCWRFPSGTASGYNVEQADAQSQGNRFNVDKLVSTDPPYYDNIGYADLSDFFYVWLRRSLRTGLSRSLSLRLPFPKAEELVATPYRHHGSKEKAESFFLDGMTRAMQRLLEQTHPAFPVTIYYAFKQSEKQG